MTYKFDAMTDEEITSFNILSPGVYDFEVIKSTRKISKSGNPMAELQLTIWDTMGKTSQLFDYLVFSKVPMTRKKIKSFCYAVGLKDAYEKSELPEDLHNLCGKVELGIEDEQPKPEGGYYPKKNKVIDYVENTNAIPVPPRMTRTDKELLGNDQDIPF